MNDVIKIENTTFQEDVATIKDVTTKVFLISGKILQGIQDNKKYKQAGYKTFAEAVQSELGLTSRNAYYLIEAATAYENVNNCSQNLPTNEAQLRPLTKLLPEQQIEVWKEVAKDKVPTAKEVQEAVNNKYKKDKNKSDSVTKTYTYFIQAPIVSIELYTKVLDKLNKVLQENMALTNTIMDCVENERKYREEIELLKNPTPQKSIVEEVILLTRTEMIDIINTYGTGFQPMILKKDKVSNKELFNTVVAIRNMFEENKGTIPNTLPKRVMLATGPEPEEDIGTLKSLPRSAIKI